MCKYNVVIIDSGINTNKYPDVSGVSIEYSYNCLSVGNCLDDEVGHGTIIYSIINKRMISDQIFVVKLPDWQEQCDDSCLIYALEYIKNNIDCNVINISLGLKSTEKYDELYKVCKALSDKGTLIISAFDNDGCYSYPASFDCVIGVDSHADIRSTDEFYFVENSPVNILAKGSVQRVTTQGGQNLIVSGSSIACAHISAITANEISKGTAIENVLSSLKTKSCGIFKDRVAMAKTKNQPFEIKNAVVFPFSKEVHAFVRFNDMLSFCINDYYDVRYSGRVGKRISSYFDGVTFDKTIVDIGSLDFANADTIILGHLGEINKLLGRDYRRILIQKAINEGVNIYSFDPLEQYLDLLNSSSIKYFYPRVTKDDVPYNTFGKLYKNDKPVLGIYGTSSQQGKFSLQLSIKQVLENTGYSVGTIGTEPHSLLFGFDVVFPMGYNSTVNLSNHDIVIYLNAQINKLCRKREIILTSTQAQIVPYYCNNMLEFPNMQYHFALGTQPDAIVMCVNIYDEIPYIRNSIYTLMGLTGATVIAFVVFPVTYVNDWKGALGNMKRKVTEEEFEQFADVLKKEFQKPAYLLGNKHHIERICQDIIDFF